MFLFASLLAACSLPGRSSERDDLDSDCESTPFVLYATLTSMDQLAWMSEQIVVGTVGAAPDADNDADHLLQIAVDTRIRGTDADQLLISTCQAGFPTQPYVESGQRVLAFLTEADRFDDQPVYHVVAGPQGLWPVTQNTHVKSPVPWSANVSVAEISASVRAALADGPGDVGALPGRPVSLEDAPIVGP